MNFNSSKGFLNKKFASLLVLLFTTVLFSDENKSLQEITEDYFENLEVVFIEKISGANSVKSTNLHVTDRFFVSLLKKHQTIHELIRCNSKGIVISDVIRGEPPKKEYRNISRQQWFRQISRTKDNYYGFVKESETGRYYLFWASPVIRNGFFVGAVASKVDLWDCFYKISDDIYYPFIIRIFGRKTLYSHKWKETFQYEEKSLNIPGIEKITARFVEEAEKISSPKLSENDNKDQNIVSDTSKEKSLETPAPVKYRKIVIFSIVILSVILLIVLIILFFKLKDWNLRRKIDKENLFS